MSNSAAHRASDALETSPGSGRIRAARWHLLLAPAFGLLLFVAWLLLARSGLYADFIVPSPAAVADRWWQIASDGSLLRHTAVTLREVLTGLILGIFAAFTLGYLIAKSRIIAYTLTPYLVALQAIPIVAIAPLLIIWFGAGMTSKVIVCALLVFFPTLINTMLGIRNIPGELRDLMDSLEATPMQTFWHLELPAALPIMIGGLKVSATLSVIGAVVGEFVSANAGLGYLINFGRGVYDTPLVIAAVFTLTALALTLYGLAAWLEALLLGWQKVTR
ncbi:MAG TPA: ABC transporter permease [Aggregatilinea sp.]|jgi:NitT/TauT family transport system permease protein|uniref:ABC transporter permease n=1 Tax=Aggregatilinea sp. TaxID=2806333 RepID=UPI002BE8079D|nr:ABC transporter permease [Aggregatilinea sp.]HML24072.1 ABC transporter permease [Aggregatilinea sp.]